MEMTIEGVRQAQDVAYSKWWNWSTTCGSGGPNGRRARDISLRTYSVGRGAHSRPVRAHAGQSQRCGWYPGDPVVATRERQSSSTSRKRHRKSGRARSDLVASRKTSSSPI